MTTVAERAIGWAEQGLVPDVVIRQGIRSLLKQRLSQLQANDCEVIADTQHDFVKSMQMADVAPLPQKANEQHYEVPAEFFRHILGDHRKYSCCHWPDEVETLDAAEESALRVTCERAALENGMAILELGCGWGSLTLWMAEQYPDSRITAVSNSHSQREFILNEAKQRDISNVDVITCDMNKFSTEVSFDRVISLEMFEHMRNYGELFRRLSGWLKPGGRFFMHIFCHRSAPYVFEDNGASDWMSRHFFSGGIMPSDDLPLHFQKHLNLVHRWRWNGKHYQKTANAWLAKMDANKETLWPILEQVYGLDNAQQWWMRWRIFFIACAELFGYDQGQQWWVSHYLFERSQQEG